MRELAEIGWPSKLVSIEVGGTSATALYVRNQRRACQEVGIAFENRSYSAETTEIEMIAALQALNVDPRVSGIIIQRPLPEHIDLDRLQNSIQGDKDVEGMNAANIGNIVYGRTALGPCTAQASVALLKSTGLDLRGLEVVIVGHSEIVGKPIALLLMEELATVTICHHGTRNLSTHTRRADALFVAVGKPGLITGDMVMPGAAVIDIGINQVDGTDGNAAARRGRRRLRLRAGGGRLDHAGARRRRPHDGGDAAHEHGRSDRAPEAPLRGGDAGPASPVSPAARVSSRRYRYEMSQPGYEEPVDR